MNEERENGRFDPADFIPADAQPKAAVSCELEEPPRGSALTGILGALFGALVGVVPWFLASTFADFFVGWLGFLVGVAACWGYRLFKGRRSTRFAMATVIVCSLLALFAAEIASWMYVLCSDPEWQADAAWYGIPVAQLAWESILMPENWGIMARHLGYPHRSAHRRAGRGVREAEGPRLHRPGARGADGRAHRAERAGFLRRADGAGERRGGLCRAAELHRAG